MESHDYYQLALVYKYALLRERFRIPGIRDNKIFLRYRKLIKQSNPDADYHFKCIRNRPNLFIDWVKANEDNYASCVAFWNLRDTSILSERHVTAAISHFLSSSELMKGEDNYSAIVDEVSTHLAQIKEGYDSSVVFVADFEKAVSREYSNFRDNQILKKYASSLSPNQFRYSIEKDEDYQRVHFELRDIAESFVQKTLFFSKEDISIQNFSVVEALKADDPDLAIMKEYIIAHGIDDIILKELKTGSRD